MRDLEELERQLTSEGFMFEHRSYSARHKHCALWTFRRPFEFGFAHGPDDEPAVEVVDTRTNVPILTEWRFKRLHRAVGPARIERNAKTGVLTKEEWFQHGRHHRTDGPSIVRYDRITGERIFEAFYANGRKLCERWVNEPGDAKIRSAKMHSLTPR